MVAPMPTTRALEAPRGAQPRRVPWRADDRGGSELVLVGLLVLVGATLRILVARQSLYGDEVATYWDVSSHGLWGLISALHGTHIEITPPLFFIAAWFTRQLGHAPLLLRLPSLIAGTLTIPAVYVLGLRTIGRLPALVACALSAVAPFMVYYSAEARAYGLMMLLVVVSTLSMLQALESGRRRWWIAYGVCSCAAAYTHYTCVFYLVGQFGWLVWLHPAARRPALLANLGAILGLLPWVSAILNAQSSYTTEIMSILSPFSLHDVRIYLEHWAIGHPYPGAGGIGEFPGPVALTLLAGAALLALVGLRLRLRPRGRSAGAHRLFGRRPALVVVLLASVPVGEALQSAVGTHVFGVRNLAASWPALALLSAALLAAAPGLRAAAIGLAITGFAIGGIKMAAGGRWARPDVQAAASFLAREAHPGDAVIDDSGVTPGPLTALDTGVRIPYRTFRATLPQESSHPFTFGDPRVPFAHAVQEALMAARSGRLFVISAFPRGGQPLRPSLPAGFRLVNQALQPGILMMSEQAYAGPDAAGG